MRQQPAGEGKEVGGEPDGEAYEENCREDPEEGGGHTATAAHACTWDAQRPKTEVGWVQEDKGTS